MVTLGCVGWQFLFASVCCSVFRPFGICHCLSVAHSGVSNAVKVNNRSNNKYVDAKQVPRIHTRTHIHILKSLDIFDILLVFCNPELSQSYVIYDCPKHQTFLWTFGAFFYAHTIFLSVATTSVFNPFTSATGSSSFAISASAFRSHSFSRLLNLITFYYLGRVAFASGFPQCWMLARWWNNFWNMNFVLYNRLLSRAQQGYDQTDRRTSDSFFFRGHLIAIGVMLPVIVLELLLSAVAHCHCNIVSSEQLH